MKTLFFAVVIAFFASFCFGSMPLYAAMKKDVWIVTNMREEPYNETVKAFKLLLASQRNLQFTEISLSQIGTMNYRSLKPDLIFALGSEATKWASTQRDKIPVISTLDFTDAFLQQSRHITGIRMYYSLPTQFLWLTKLFPAIKRIGILYNPQETAALVTHAKTIAKKAGFNLIAYPVASPRELPLTLARVRNDVDIVLAIPDPTIYSDSSINEIFLFSFRNKLPLIGLADNWTRSGAIYSLSWDFADLGRQSGAIALKILNGASVQSIYPEYPRKVAYTINSKVAERMNIKIPEKILSKAKMVY